jgi:DNA-binding GntR family transcriptional regulator
MDTEPAALADAPADARVEVGQGTLGEQVYAQLADRLIAGELAPGDKISLRSLAESLGTSMMPVRAAVARLVTDGALTVSPKRAVAVPVMNAGKFRELTVIRLAVEGFAAERAAAERSEADLALIREHDAAFRAQSRAAAPDVRAAVRANRNLHFAVYAAAGLPTLVDMIAGLWLRIGPVLNLDMRGSPERLSGGSAEAHHARLVTAIARSDGALARRALGDDIAAAAAFIEATGRLAD